MTLALATIVTLLMHSCMGAATATNENSDSDAVEVASPAGENREVNNSTTAAIIPAGEWLEMPAVAPEGKYPDAERQARKLYDYHPYSYEYEMAPFTLWDDKRLIRNMWEITDWSHDLIRIIIHDHKVVYFDVWSW